MSTTRVVFITGTSTGIGLATAVRFAKEGWRTYASVRTFAKQELLVKEVAAANASANLTVVELEVSDEKRVHEVVADIVAKEGRIDAVVNNAGFVVLGAVETASRADFIKQYDTNVFGALSVIQAALPTMRAQKSGRVINVSSVGGVLSMPLFGTYASSKFALEALTQSLSFELQPYNIQAVIIQPGATDTPIPVSGTQYTTRQTENADYEAQLKASKEVIATILKTSTAPSVVADTIYTAATAASPHLRYQCTEADSKMIANILVRPNAQYDNPFAPKPQTTAPAS